MRIPAKLGTDRREKPYEKSLELCLMVSVVYQVPHMVQTSYKIAPHCIVRLVGKCLCHFQKVYS